MMLMTGAMFFRLGTDVQDIDPDEARVRFIMAAVIFAGGCIVSYFGLERFRGKNCRYVKKNPNLFALAEDLDQNPVYEDKFVVISGKAIAPKKDFSAAAALEDVLAVYEYSYSMNGIKTEHKLKLELINGRVVQIGVYGKKKDVVDQLLLTISHYCPNAAVGYSNEMLRYVNAKRKVWKAEQKAKKKA
jgi:hypothetical protein